ncbi:MAG TPA: response regulator [Chloroflexota bacterium]|nr:response regulator [Chloroflexota bacterium]
MKRDTWDVEPVLVVDDDPDLRLAIQWALEDEGLEVVTAADGREALDVGTRSQPSLVVLDIGLPVLDGYAVAAGLRQTHGYAVPILVVTADGRAAEKAERVEAFDYLHKPFELDDLLSAVRRGLG